ncbi:MAG TPA: xanthine dehydrogenase family protein subunit M [Caldilineaceae bacterium]|nr:xanthine dehydrogenase family protein subunit M [Caldilineaceae bacterium]
MRRFDYIRAGTLDETLQLLGSGDGQNGGPTGDGATRPLAGGTDLLTLMKADVAAPARLVDIKRLAELPRGIEERADAVSLGALTTLSEIELSELLQARYPALVQAAALAATPQLRNMATLGGNLLQRPRCWYFRHELFHCWLKGGDECHAYDGQNQHHALFGGGPCYAVHPSDLAPALLALEAQVRLRGPAGERTVSLADFYALPETGRRQETTIPPDELVVAVQLPALPEGTRSLYLKAMDRKVWAFALVSVAALLRMAEGRIADVRLVLGGVAPIPWRVQAAEQVLAGQQPGTELFAHAAEVALAGAEALEHNGYKIPLAQSLIRQALQTLADQTGAGD